MSLEPGGFTAHIDCMIIAGFPGIGKTSTYNEMKASLLTARVVDMDVKKYGTTNGIDVADPAAYVNEMMKLSKENALILCTTDPKVRQKMQEAGLFYVVVCPEFPPKIAEHLPFYRPDPNVRKQYMKRFEQLGGNHMAGQALDGKGYDDAILDVFQDPMPHFVGPLLNKTMVSVVWQGVEAQTRVTMSQSAFMGLGLQRPMMQPGMPPQPMFPGPPPHR